MNAPLCVHTCAVWACVSGGGGSGGGGSGGGVCVCVCGGWLDRDVGGFVFVSERRFTPEVCVPHT